MQWTSTSWVPEMLFTVISGPEGAKVVQGPNTRGRFGKNYNFSHSDFCNRYLKLCYSPSQMSQKVQRRSLRRHIAHWGLCKLFFPCRL
jgi:hypothetical protein